jgi:hypothetical protein
MSTGGKGSNAPIQPYQGGQQTAQSMPSNTQGPFGMGLSSVYSDDFGGGQQAQQGGPMVGGMLQAAAQGQPQFMQQQNLGNSGIAGLAGYPTDKLNQLQGLMGPGGQISPEYKEFQDAEPQGGQDTTAAQNALNTQQGGFMQNLLRGGGGYGKGGGGSMPSPYQQGGQQGDQQSSPFGLYSSGPYQGGMYNMAQVQRPDLLGFNPARDEGMVAPGTQAAAQTGAPMPTQLGMQMAAPTQAVAPTPAPVAPTAEPAMAQTPAQQLPDQSQGLSYRGMMMKKGGKVR